MNQSRTATCQWSPRTVGTTNAYCACSSAATYFFHSSFFLKANLIYFKKANLILTTRLWSSGDNQSGKSWVRSRWEVVALEGPSGPIRTRLQTRGHWWDLHGVITSPPGGLGGLPG